MIDIDDDQIVTFITRRTFVMIFDRIDQARRRDQISEYDIMLFEKHDYQQIRILNWFDHNTKKTFDKAHIDFFVRWNDVKIDHDDNCVLCSKNWIFLKFSNFQHIDNAFMLFFRNSNRLMFQRKNHNTIFMRILIWFDDKFWFKHDIELNNFLNSEFFQLKNVSHLCHQNHCVIFNHVIYESMKINQNRKIYCHHAMQLRDKSMNIFSYCIMHNFSCKLQIWFFFTY